MIDLDDFDKLPPAMQKQVRRHFQNLVDEGIRSGEKHGWIPGDVAMKRIEERLQRRFKRPSHHGNDRQ